MTLLGECHCMRECCESYYFMFHNIIFISVFFCLLCEVFHTRKSAGRWWHVHTKNRNEGFMDLSVKLFLGGYFAVLLFPTFFSFCYDVCVDRKMKAYVACACSSMSTNEWIFTINGASIPLVSFPVWIVSVVVFWSVDFSFQMILKVRTVVDQGDYFHGCKLWILFSDKNAVNPCINPRLPKNLSKSLD